MLQFRFATVPEVDLLRTVDPSPRVKTRAPVRKRVCDPGIVFGEWFNVHPVIIRLFHATNSR